MRSRGVVESEFLEAFLCCFPVAPAGGCLDQHCESAVGEGAVLVLIESEGFLLGEVEQAILGRALGGGNAACVFRRTKPLCQSKAD